MELRPADIKEILRIFAESEIEELRLELGSTRLHVSKREGAYGPATYSEELTAVTADPNTVGPGASPSGTIPAVAHASVDATPFAAPLREGLVELRSPLLGVFYRRAAPDKPPFIEVGGSVQADDPVCIVEVMKMFTQIPAGVAGRIAEICVEDGQLVQHGQLLMWIEPA